MTLTDISRLLKFAGVPRSKTVQCGYPNPRIIVHVDASHFPVVREVVERMRAPSDDIAVSLLESHDVGPREHVYVKWKGDNAVHDRDGNSIARTHPEYNERRAWANRGVVLECASVVV